MVARVFKVPRPTLADRFWAKVNKDGPIMRPELGPCWLWTAAMVNGYGVLGIGGKKARPVRAHRVAFFLRHGRWPTPCGLHRCDNKPCVRWGHIFEGTKADNNRDRAAKGRGNHPRGEANAKAVLTDRQVGELRESARSGEPIAALAARYQISLRGTRHLVQGTRR